MVDNHEGSIRVTTWDRDQVKYGAEIMPTEEDPNVEKVTIRTRTSNDRFRLAIEHEEADDESGIFGGRSKRIPVHSSPDRLFSGAQMHETLQGRDDSSEGDSSEEASLEEGEMT